MSQKMGLIGRKLGMTRYFHDDGSSLGCTVLELVLASLPDSVPWKSTVTRPPQLGFEEQNTRNMNSTPGRRLQEGRHRKGVGGRARNPP